LGNRRTRQEQVKAECHKSQDRAHHMAKNLSCVVGPTWRLMGQNIGNFGSMDSSWSKVDYIYPPPPLVRWGDGETWNTPNTTDCEDRREMLLEPLPVAPSTPLAPSPSTPWWRGSSLPLDYGIAEVTCIKLPFMLCWLESHELPVMIVTIFVLPYGGSNICEIIYEIQRCLCSWCMSRYICYPAFVCLLWSN
jgi:hypothetical protein